MCEMCFWKGSIKNNSVLNYGIFQSGNFCLSRKLTSVDHPSCQEFWSKTGCSYSSCRLTHSLFALSILPGIEKVLLLLFFWWGRGTPLDHQVRVSASFPGAVANGILSFSLLRISWYLNRGWESIYLAVEPITYAKLTHTLLMTF